MKHFLLISAANETKFSLTKSLTLSIFHKDKTNVGESKHDVLQTSRGIMILI